MKSIIKPIIAITVFFMIIAAVTYIVIGKHFSAEDGMKNVVMNRITSEVEDSYAKEFKEQGSNAQLGLDNLPDLDKYRQEFGRKYIPDEVISQRGFLYFTDKSDDRIFTLEVAGIILFISYFAVMALMIICYNKMINPFNRLSDYPEKIAKGRMDTGIPETKQRLFGKYVWGMNMLRDEMKHKEKALNMMEKEKQTLIVSIAHGIKTPLSNIKLYAEAIERGIYHDNKPNEKDAETAAKIGQNVDKVEALVREIMDKSTQYDVTYEPSIRTFYLKELAATIKSEYSSRIELLHIPFDIKCENNPLVTSDADGIYTIVSQLMENAIKYGSGQGISVTMGSQDEDVYITVKNKGNVLSEEENAYVFKSFWRGSNSKNTEGQGIGLYVAKKMAEALSGDIFMKAWEAEETTEVTLIIPLS